MAVLEAVSSFMPLIVLIMLISYTVHPRSPFNLAPWPS